MASSYPGAIDSLVNPDAVDPLSNPAHSGQHSDANDAIEAIETTLGVNPQGTFSTVGDRIGNAEVSASAAQVSASAAAVSASLAAISSGEAGTSAVLASQWAVQLPDPVAGSGLSASFSARYWSNVSASAAQIAGTTAGVLYQHAQTLTADITLDTNKNAISAGPIFINTGVTVTVPIGSTWAVL